MTDTPKPSLELVDDSNIVRMRPADNVIQGLRDYADELEKLEVPPAYLMTVCALGDVRIFGPAPRDGAEAEQAAYCILLAQKRLMSISTTMFDK